MYIHTCPLIRLHPGAAAAASGRGKTPSLISCRSRCLTYFKSCWFQVGTHFIRRRLDFFDPAFWGQLKLHQRASNSLLKTHRPSSWSQRQRPLLVVCSIDFALRGLFQPNWRLHKNSGRVSLPLTPYRLPRLTHGIGGIISVLVSSQSSQAERIHTQAGACTPSPSSPPASSLLSADFVSLWRVRTKTPVINGLLLQLCVCPSRF